MFKKVLVLLKLHLTFITYFDFKSSFFICLIKLEFVRCSVHLSGFPQSGDPVIKAEGGLKAEGGVKAEADAAISRVLLQSLSIPVTMRLELLYVHFFKYRGV